MRQSRAGERKRRKRTAAARAAGQGRYSHILLACVEIKRSGRWLRGSGCLHKSLTGVYFTLANVGAACLSWIAQLLHDCFCVCVCVSTRALWDNRIRERERKRTASLPSCQVLIVNQCVMLFFAALCPRLTVHLLRLWGGGVVIQPGEKEG